MSITKDMIQKTANLAMLSLNEDELEQTAGTLNKILASFQGISEVDTESVEPLVTPFPIDLQLREDHVVVDISTTEALQNSPQKTGHLFTVPPVV